MKLTAHEQLALVVLKHEGPFHFQLCPFSNATRDRLVAEGAALVGADLYVRVTAAGCDRINALAPEARFTFEGPDADREPGDTETLSLADVLPQVGEDADEVTRRLAALAVGEHAAFGGLVIVRTS